MAWWSAAWAVWLAVFFALEVPALLNRRRGDTFSEHVWRWFAVRRKGRFAVTRRVLLVVVLVWLVAHFMTGGLV